MSRRLRLAVFLPGLGGLAALLAWAVGGLPAFGDYHGVYGLRLLRVAVRQSDATNLPTAINFFYRTLDTVGEEFILFAAAMGIALMMRRRREQEERPPVDQDEVPPAPPASDAVRLLAGALVAPTLVLGLYIVVHGHLTPGGGFQGSVVVAGGIVLAYLSGAYVSVRRAEPWMLLEGVESMGAGGYVVVGLAGIIAGRAIFANVLPGGTIASLTSAGTIPVANVVVTLEVAAAFVLVVSELRERSLIVRRRR